MSPTCPSGRRARYSSYSLSLRPWSARNRAFTIVEILVVTVILVILAALASAAYSRAQTGVQRNKCAANMRQVWIATMLYVGENNWRLPKDVGNADVGPQKINGQSTSGVGRIALKLAPYIGDEVWQCPDPRTLKSSTTSGGDFGRVWRKRATTGWRSGNPFHRDTPEEFLKWENLPNQWVVSCYPPPRYYPHNWQMNMLAMDGHVEIVDYR